MSASRPTDQPPDPNDSTDAPADDAAADERVDLLADRGGPTLERKAPVRPRELDLVRPESSDAPAPSPQAPRPSEPARRPAPAPPSGSAAPDPAPAPASTTPSVGVEDGPVLCSVCKYDLRGRPGGARCPECGTIIRAPRRIRIVLPEGQRKSTRDALFDAWHNIAGSCLASVVVVSPLVYFLPLGVAIASCVGFAAAFRLWSLRSLRELPAPLREPLDGLISWWRWLERVQAGIAVVITVGGLLSTVGLVGHHAIPLYYSALCIWWALASAAVRAQLRLGDRLAVVLVDPEVLPLDAAPRIIRWARLNGYVGVAGGVCAVYGALGLGLGVRPIFAEAASVAASILLIVATLFQCVVSLHARAHAVLVANCVFESVWFRADPNRGLRRHEKPGEDFDDSPEAVPLAKRHSFTPKGDDAPIRLPGE